jgi:hypothetical protein
MMNFLSTNNDLVITCTGCPKGILVEPGKALACALACRAHGASGYLFVEKIIGLFSRRSPIFYVIPCA